MVVRGEEVEVVVELGEGEVARELWSRLSMQTKARIRGEEVHFPVLIPTGTEPGNSAEVEAEHVAYYSPENAVCLFFGQASGRTDLTLVGRIVEGLEDCRRIDANEDLRIEAVEG
jgi:hypothetical protein